MKVLSSQKLSYTIVSLALLISVACKAVDPAPGSLQLSKQERDEIIEHSNATYVYLGSELSDIKQVVKQMSNLYNNDKIKGVHELHNHMNSGYNIGQYDEVVAVLTEALITLDNDIKSEELAVQLKDNIERLQSGELNVEVVQQSTHIRSNQAKEDDEIDTQLQAQGMPITIEEEGMTYDCTEFKGSVVDATCDLVVDCNILMSDTDSSVGTILKNDTRFIHNFGTGNTFVGKEAGNLTMTGTGKNTGVGVYALSFNTTGIKNTGMGFNALGSNTTGILNTAMGHTALKSNITGDFNTAIGNNALQANTTNSHNTAVGNAALKDNTGAANTAVGSRALLENTKGEGNTAVGDCTLSKNTTGQFNIALGINALINVEGNRNIGIGKDSAESLTSGDDNIYIGSDSGAEIESNQIRIGESQIDCFIQGIHDSPVDGETGMTVLVDSDGKLGTIASSSSKTYKSNTLIVEELKDTVKNLLARIVVLEELTDKKL